MRVTAGEAVFEEGGPIDGLYILLAGTLAVDSLMPPRHGTKPQRHKLGEIAAGEAFGESALLEGKAVRTKTVRCASSECEVIRILARDFLRLVEKSPVVRESFERLHKSRQLHNEFEEDPEIRKYAMR